MLDIRFSDDRAGWVRLGCDQQTTSVLASLRWRLYRSARLIGDRHLDVPLDEYCESLSDLVDVWPDEHWVWQPEVERCVVEAEQDRQLMADHFQQGAQPAVKKEAVLSTDWHAPLTDTQRREIAHLQQLKHGACFSVPGAGKTRSVMAVFAEMRERAEAKQLLVVCPKSAFEAWREEGKTCLSTGPQCVAVMSGPAVPAGPIVLVNYERLPDSRAALIAWLSQQPSMVVLDEAHRMKRGPAGVWGQACYQIAPYARKRLILSGTPAPQGADDLKSLFGFVWPSHGRSEVTRALAGSSLEAASARLQPLFVRTTKQELGLPPLETVVTKLDLPPVHRELYQTVIGELGVGMSKHSVRADGLRHVVAYLLMAATTPSLLAVGGHQSDACFIRDAEYRYDPLKFMVGPYEPSFHSTLEERLADLPRVEEAPKYQEVDRIVEQNAQRNRKTLVWSTYVRNLTTLDRYLARFNPAVVHGGTTDADRCQALRRFREDPDCAVLLSNPATLGEAISLHQVCHDAVYLDRDFSAGKYMQSLDRIHRLGLAPDVETKVTVLVSRNTIDERVDRRLSQKLRFMGKILDDRAIQKLSDLTEVPAVFGHDLDKYDQLEVMEHLDSALVP